VDGDNMKDRGAKKPPRFAKGKLLRASQLNALSDAIHGRAVPGIQSVDPLRVQGKLTSALPAATAFDSDAATASFQIWRKNASGVPVAAETITVVNRFLFIDLPTNTVCKAEWIEGEWQIYAADCGAE
jgi:hypothetical protein